MTEPAEARATVDLDSAAIMSMPPAAGQGLWKLEDAYLTIIQDSLPLLSSKRRKTIRPHLYVVDLTSEDGCVRHVRPSAWDQAWSADVSRRVHRLLEQAALDTAEQYNLLSDGEALPKAIRRVRQLLSGMGLPLDALEWAMPGTLPSDILGRNHEEKERWSLYPRLVDQIESTDAFVRVLGVLSCALRDVPFDQLTRRLVESTAVVEFPFSALGARRAVALWLLVYPDERTEPTRLLDAHFAETLERLFSAAVIDVLSAQLMKNVGLTTTLGGGSTSEIAAEALRYLYPSRKVRIHLANEPLPEPSSDPMRYTLIFRQEAVRRFLGINGATYDLVQSITWDPESAKARTYLDLLESKIRDHVVLAAQEMDEQYGKLLGVFGHHTGTLFKTSGAFQVWIDASRGIAPSAADTKRMLDRLLPVWGISRAISLVQKQGQDDELPMPLSWFDGRYLERDRVGEEVKTAVLTMVRYVFEHSMDAAPFLPWVFRDGETSESWEWDERPENRKTTLMTLPPFADDPIVLDKTLAATIGLFEMITNVRRYPPDRGYGRGVRRLLGTLPEELRRVVVTVHDQGGEFRLRVEQPVVVDAHGEIPASRSLERIRLYERQCLRGYVFTGHVGLSGKTGVNRVVRVHREWVFKWSALLERFRSVPCLDV